MRKVKISEFADVITGGTPSTTVPEYWDGGTIPWLQSGVCQNCIVTECNTFITQAGLDNSAAKMMKPDSVLIALTGATTGKVGYLTFDACANQSVTGIQPNDKFVPKYLYYYLLGIRQKILDDSYGGAQKHISQGYVKNLKIPLGTICEQREMAERFEHVDRIISLRQQEIKRLDDLIKARFVEMFGDPVVNDRGWQKITLFESLEAGRTVTYGIVQTGDEFENGTPVFRPIDIAGGHVPKREELKKTDPLISAQYKRTLLKGNELLITVRGSVGETFQTTDEFKGCNVGRNIVPLVTDSNKVLQRFLQELFAQDAIKNWLKGITKGIALQGLNMGEFKEMPVIVPPIAMQRAFVVFAMQVDKSKVAVQKALDEARLLFDSLMHQYFG